jgi:hypothetical protein
MRNSSILSLGAIAAIAGAYFLYGSSKGPARRQALKGWMVKMKGEVMEEVEKMENVSKDLYYSAIDKIKEKYELMQDVDEAELNAIVKRLKGHWKDIKKEAEKEIKKSIKTKTAK